MTTDSIKFDCAIINTGAGNLTSLSQAISRINASAIIINNANEFLSTSFSRIIIPGQGRFGSVMENLQKTGLDKMLQQWRQQGKPILGICVGMQIFFENSDEDPEVAGFGWLEGRAQKLNFPKRPMVGWCEIESKKQQLPTGTAYFVNSFAIKESCSCIANSEYGERFCSAVEKENLTGVQFHPEKSSRYGLEVLKKCLDC